MLLDRILHLAGTFRHRLSMRSGGRNDVPWTESKCFTAWLQHRDRLSGNIWRRQLDSGLDRQRRSSCQIVVARGPTNWALPTPVLSTADAVRVCSRPAQLVVENGRNDPKFLLAFARPDQRDFWDKCIKDRVIEVRGPGGLTEVLAHARAIANDHHESFRAVFVCDSDALAPGRASKHARELVRLRSPVVEAPWRVGRGFALSRRAAENYLPIPTLTRWAASQTRDASALRLRQVRALADSCFSQVPDRRFHYNMKKGFCGDVGHDRREERGTLYDFAAIPAEMLSDLCCGLGDHVRDAYEMEVSEVEARADGSLDEMRKLIGAVLAMVE